MNDPIADSTRGILDGHIVLSRRIAHAGHYPAIDVLASVSRVMKEIVTPEHYAAANELKRLLAVYRDAEDLINIGAYKSGANRDIDQAIRYKDAIMRYTGQGIEEHSNLEEAIRQLMTDFIPK